MQYMPAFDSSPRLFIASHLSICPSSCRLYPDAWEHYLAPIPEEERSDLMAAYHKRLTSEDEAVRLEAAKAWSVWEGCTSKLTPDPSYVATFEDPALFVSFARIENHYFVNNGWFEPEQLIKGIAAVRAAGIPGVIVQGAFRDVFGCR